MLIYFIPLVSDQELTGDLQPIVSIPGVDANIHYLSPENLDITLKIDPSWHFEQYGFYLSPSEIKNYQLHYNAWQLFLKQNDDWCLIVDASVKLEASATAINEVMQTLDEGWDVFFPFDRMTIQEEENALIMEKLRSMINWNSKEKKDPLPHLLGFSWGNSIYFLSKQGCRKLMGNTSIRQRVDDEILQLSMDEKIEVFCQEVEWFNYGQQPVLKSRDRNRAIYEAITERSRWTPQNKEKVQLLLKTISNIAAKLNIDLLLQGGSHLGYVRHGGIMPWDDDVDLGINEKDLPAFLAEVEKTTGLYQMMKIEERSGIPFYKLWMDDGEQIDGYDYKFPFVDLWLFKIIGKDLVANNGIISPGSAQYPYQEIIFENAAFKIVANSVEALDARYRTWKKGIRVYNYHHRQERIEGYPLRVEISVNENGKMIDL